MIPSNWWKCDHTHFLSFSLLPSDWKWHVKRFSDDEITVSGFFHFSVILLLPTQCISQMYFSNDDIAVSWCFHFSVIPLLPIQCISSLISRLKFQTTIFPQEICFSWKQPHLRLDTVKIERLCIYQVGLGKNPTAKRYVCLRYFLLDRDFQD